MRAGKANFFVGETHVISVKVSDEDLGEATRSKTASHELCLRSLSAVKHPQPRIYINRVLNNSSNNLQLVYTLVSAAVSGAISSGAIMKNELTVFY